jgi:hypothetical protein
MPVPPNPTVVVRITGLIAFCFDKQFAHCQMGIHSKTDDHELSIRFIKKGPGPEDESEQTMTISHALIRQSADLWLDIEGEPSPKQRTAEPFIADGNDEPPTDPHDFRHVVDLEGEHFYNRRLKIKDGVLTPSVFIRKGLFYTAALTSRRYKTKTISSDGVETSPSRRIGQVAADIGVNIYLDHANQALVLRAGSKGGAELFRLANEEGVTYEIIIDNRDNGLSPPSQPGNHFAFYYDAIDLDPEESRILIEPNGSIESGDCIGSTFGKSHSLGGGQG